MKNHATETVKVRQRGAFVATVVDNESLGGDYRSITLELSDVAGQCFSQARAGQFVQLACRRLDDPRAVAPLLRRPFSIADVEIVSAEKVRLRIILDVVGPGTGWLAHRRKGEQVDLIGPLGKGFILDEDREKPILLIGGGVGLPPLYLLAKELQRAGHEHVTAFAGVRSVDCFPGKLRREKYDSDDPLAGQMVVDEFARCDTPAVVATDDGSFGFAGNAVQAVEAFLAVRGEERETQMYACGPSVMLKGVAGVARRCGYDCQVCLEEYMACGIGVCQSCVVATRAKTAEGGTASYRLVCANGPVFDASTIIWQ